MTDERIQILIASKRPDRAPKPKFICPGCGRSESFGVKITSHLVTQMDGVLRECSGVGNLPTTSEVPSSTLRIRNP